MSDDNYKIQTLVQCIAVSGVFVYGFYYGTQNAFL